MENQLEKKMENEIDREMTGPIGILMAGKNDWVSVEELNLSYYIEVNHITCSIYTRYGNLSTLNPKPLNPKPLNPKP